MFKSTFVSWLIIILKIIVELVTIDPGTAKKARTFTFKLTNYLSTRNTVIDKRVFSALAVTDFTISSYWHLAQVFYNFS